MIHNINHPPEGLLYKVRAQIIDSIVLITVVLMTFGLLGSLNRMLLLGFLPIFIFHIGTYVFVVFLALAKKRLSPNFKSICIIVIFFTIGCVGLYNFGPITNATMAMLLSIILATVTFGLSAGLLIGFLCVFFIAALGAMITHEIVNFGYAIRDNDMTASMWINLTTSFTMVAGIIIFVVAKITATVQELVIKIDQKNHQLEVDITNLAKVEKDLLSVQENLDATVKKRTAELYAEIQNHQFAQQTISLQQSHLRNALDNIESAAIIMVDKDLMITAISKQFSTLYNLPAEYCKEGQSIEPILRARALRGDYGKGDVEKLLKERVRKWKRNQPHDYLDFSPDGHVFQVYPKKTSDGGLIAVSMDISKHLRVEEKLNLQKNHLRNALDNVPGAVFMVDKDLKITASSLHMADLYDLPSSICKEGEPLIPLLRIRAERGDYGKGDAATLLKKRIDKWRHNPSGFYEDKVPSGKIYGVQSTRMEDGGMVIAVTDITERKAIEKKINAHQKELETLNTQKDNFFAIIAHDLKSPFNALLGFSEVLSKDITKLSPEKIQDYSGYVHQAAQQSYNLLEDLLHWSRLQLDRVEINLAPLDVNEVIDASLSRLRYIADAKGIKTSVEKTEGLMVIADANMLDTILRNLLSNAIKFTQHSGKIEVSSRKVKKHVHIEVKDNGIGMSKQEIGGLFNFDKNSSKPGTDGETGTGLGLHLCKELLGKQKGKISIKSTEGAGSSFTIILPLS